MGPLRDEIEKKYKLLASTHDVITAHSKAEGSLCVCLRSLPCPVRKQATEYADRLRSTIGELERQESALTWPTARLRVIELGCQPPAEQPQPIQLSEWRCRTRKVTPAAAFAIVALILLSPVLAGS